MAGMARQPLTTEQVAKILNCHRRHVIRMVREGQIQPQMKLTGPGGAYLFAAAEVDRVVRVEREAIIRRRERDARRAARRESNGTAA